VSNKLKKTLKILFTIEFVVILAIIILVLANNEKTVTGYVVKESLSKADFKILTKAVCEEKTDHVFCEDRLFVKCNSQEYLITDNNLENFTGCSDLKLNLSGVKVTGSSIFGKEWNDPRDEKN